jgi:hypothetical protein
MSIRITCIKKAGGYHEDPHEAISTLGWVEDGSGNRGSMSREEMYVWIKDKGGEAYVLAGGRVPLDVEIGDGASSGCLVGVV